MFVREIQKVTETEAIPEIKRISEEELLATSSHLMKGGIIKRVGDKQLPPEMPKAEMNPNIDKDHTTEGLPEGLNKMSSRAHGGIQHFVTGKLSPEALESLKHAGDYARGNKCDTCQTWFTDKEFQGHSHEQKPEIKAMAQEIFDALMKEAPYSKWKGSHTERSTGGVRQPSGPERVADAKDANERLPKTEQKPFEAPPETKIVADGPSPEYLARKKAAAEANPLRRQSKPKLNKAEDAPIESNQLKSPGQRKAETSASFKDEDKHADENYNSEIGRAWRNAAGLKKTIDKVLLNNPTNATYTDQAYENARRKMNSKKGFTLPFAGEDREAAAESAFGRDGERITEVPMEKLKKVVATALAKAWGTGPAPYNRDSDKDAAQEQRDQEEQTDQAHYDSHTKRDIHSAKPAGFKHAVPGPAEHKLMRTTPVSDAESIEYMSPHVGGGQRMQPKHKEPAKTKDLRANIQNAEDKPEYELPKANRLGEYNYDHHTRKDIRSHTRAEDLQWKFNPKTGEDEQSDVNGDFVPKNYDIDKLQNSEDFVTIIDNALAKAKTIKFKDQSVPTEQEQNRYFRDQYKTQPKLTREGLTPAQYKDAKDDERYMLDRTGIKRRYTLKKDVDAILAKDEGYQPKLMPDKIPNNRVFAEATRRAKAEGHNSFVHDSPGAKARNTYAEKIGYNYELKLAIDNLLAKAKQEPWFVTPGSTDHPEGTRLVERKDGPPKSFRTPRERDWDKTNRPSKRIDRKAAEHASVKKAVEAALEKAKKPASNLSPMAGTTSPLWSPSGEAQFQTINGKIRRVTGDDYEKGKLRPETLERFNKSYSKEPGTPGFDGPKERIAGGQDWIDPWDRDHPEAIAYKPKKAKLPKEQDPKHEMNV